MARIWTHGVWAVKAGHEDEFMAAWRKLVPIGAEIGSETPVLLRDREQPNVFRSFGPWADLGEIDRFRAAIRPHMGAMEDLLDRFETFTLDEAYPGE
jgi:quinol monooxygenase YgiN